MKPSFHARHLNSPFEDPAVYVRLLREGRALMFDLGWTSALSVRDILKTTDIFVSHTHVDHFIGFDNILRVSLKRETPLRLYGPEGFTDCVEGKLKGYTWNLTGEYPLAIHVSEVSESSVRKTVFRAETSFRREDSGTAPFDGVLLSDSFFNVSAAVLDHRIPCLAFSLQEDYHINIDKDKLRRLNLPVGPWLRELKAAIRENRTGAVFTIGGKDYTFGELRDTAGITRGQKISYVVDVLGSRQNTEKIIRLVKGSDILYIESYFLDRDRDRARERRHLTAREAGRIAREAGVARLEAIHFSPRYADEAETPAREAESEFQRVQGRGV